MRDMFSDCELLSLPDISKWDNSKVTHLYSMFEGCKSLTSLHDTSKWNISNVTNMSDKFNGYKKLKNIPKKFKNRCIIV